MSTATVEELVKQIDAKLRMLKFTNEDTTRILTLLKEQKVKTIERHAKVFEDLIDEAHNLKVVMQQKRIEEGDASEEVRK